MKVIALIILITTGLFQDDLCGQSLKDVLDPMGNVLKINEDSSYIFNAFGYLITYAFDQTEGTKNILFFNGDTSYWLFNSGFAPTLAYSSFTRTEKFGTPGNKIWFRIGDVWYQTRGSQATTTVFNDNNDPGKPYQFLQLFNFKTGDLGIEAIEKNSGDTLTLIYNVQNNMFSEFKDEFGNRIKVIQVAERFGSNETKDFVGAISNSLTQEYDFYGIYSWSPSNLNQILELGKRSKYGIRYIYKDYISYQYIVDSISEFSAKVYEYNVGTGNFDDVSTTIIPDHEVIDAFNLPVVSYDGELNDYKSFTESLWKCTRPQIGGYKYFILSAFANDVEINHIRDEANVTFMYESINDDSIYLYNHRLTQRGLIRFNTINKINAFHPTSIQFTQDFHLRGWKGSMYFGRYDAALGQIVAAYKDFGDASYHFIESWDGKRVDNPIDFSFLDDRVFIHSKQADEVKLVYFDTTTIVAVNDPLENDVSINIIPNPSNGQIRVQLGEQWETSLSNAVYQIFEYSGKQITHGKLTSNLINISLTNKTPGLYFFTVLTKGNSITKIFSIE